MKLTKNFAGRATLPKPFPQTLSLSDHQNHPSRFQILASPLAVFINILVFSSVILDFSSVDILSGRLECPHQSHIDVMLQPQ